MNTFALTTQFMFAGSGIFTVTSKTGLRGQQNRHYRTYYVPFDAYFTSNVIHVGQNRIRSVGIS